MATKVRNFRLDDELWDAMGRLAKSRGSTRTAVVVEGVRRLLADPSGDWGLDSPFLPPELAGAAVSPGSVAERVLVEPGEKQVFSRRAVVECPRCDWVSGDRDAKCPTHGRGKQIR